MADEMDRAQAINEQWVEGCLAAHRKKTSEVLGSSEVCEYCGEEIPEARRKAMPGCTRCITCQEAFEIHSHWRAL